MDPTTLLSRRSSPALPCSHPLRGNFRPRRSLVLTCDKYATFRPVHLRFCTRESNGVYCNSTDSKFPVVRILDYQTRNRVRIRKSSVMVRSYGAGIDQLENSKATDREFNDAELDELFQEYGEVVRADPEPRSPTSEVDDDNDGLAFAVAVAEAAHEVKAGDIRILFVKPLVYWTSFFVIATGYSRPQVDAIGKRIRDLAEQRFKRNGRGDLKPNSWTLLDYGDVIVHVFFPKERAYYNLEEFYSNAPIVELSFKSEVRQ